MSDQLERQLEFSIQFIHPEKSLTAFPGATPENVSRLYGLTVEQYEQRVQRYVERTEQAAEELLADPNLVARVDELPFPPRSVVLGLGDSITDDRQSWFEILRHMLQLRRPDDQIQLVNAGISGETTSQMIARTAAVREVQPDWVFCFAGTNDARTHLRDVSPTPMASLGETERNLTALREGICAERETQWVWVTPASVLKDRIHKHFQLGAAQLTWSNTHLKAIADIVRRQPEPVVDLQEALGMPPEPHLMLEDGVHPSLEGQKAIVTAVIKTLVSQP